MDKKLIIIIFIAIVLIGGLIFAAVEISQSKNEYTGTTTAKDGDNNSMRIVMKISI